MEGNPQEVYLKLEIDAEGNSSLVGAWDTEPEFNPKGMGPVFPCRNRPNCYCIIVGGREVPIYCLPGAQSEQKSS